MALSTNLLEKLPPALVSSLKIGANSAHDAAATHNAAATHDAAVGRTLPTGFPAIDRQLPGGGLLTGALVEFAVAGAASLATTLGLAACRSAQRAAEQLGGTVPWCAFIDPSRSLYAPGVAHAGVRLDRLLVVRPPITSGLSGGGLSNRAVSGGGLSNSAETLGRVALRVVESQCFAVIVIDTVGVPGAELNVPLGSWPRIVRRLALALQETQSTVLLITDSTARRPLPLPVAQRIELQRSQAHKLILQVAKDRQGRVSAPVSIDLNDHSVWAARDSGVLREDVRHVG
ncbi:MAG TPA: recombinase A [Polyangiaceae bacterium]|nr:recombinase A [Polyangiaceae bacterium]